MKNILIIYLYHFIYLHLFFLYSHLLNYQFYTLLYLLLITYLLLNIYKYIIILSIYPFKQFKYQ